jgi:hypothetical protein
MDVVSSTYQTKVSLLSLIFMSGSGVGNLSSCSRFTYHLGATHIHGFSENGINKEMKTKFSVQLK